MHARRSRQGREHHACDALPPITATTTAACCRRNSSSRLEPRLFSLVPSPRRVRPRWRGTAREICRHVYFSVLRDEIPGTGVPCTPAFSDLCTRFNASSRCRASCSSAARLMALRHLATNRPRSVVRRLVVPLLRPLKTARATARPPRGRLKCRDGGRISRD